MDMLHLIGQKSLQKDIRKYHNKITKMFTNLHYQMLALVLILEIQMLQQTNLLRMPLKNQFLVESML